jgi:hypothetical protein
MRLRYGKNVWEKGRVGGLGTVLAPSQKLHGSAKYLVHRPLGLRKSIRATTTRNVIFDELSDVYGSWNWLLSPSNIACNA